MKKGFLVIILIIIILILGGIWYGKTIKDKKMMEVIPEEEISDLQERMTIVSLYYFDIEEKTLKKEDHLIDVKKLINTPYETLFNLLKEKPKSEKLQSVIPEGTKFNQAELKNGILYLDLSKEFIENHSGGKDEELQTVYSIVNTLTELIEINQIKILIDGEENQKFKDGLVGFSENFLKINN